MGSYIMIGWLVQTPFYVPLTFETGMTTGILSIISANVGFKFIKLFSNTDASSQSNLYLFKTVKNIIKPIHSLDLLLNDPVYADGVKLLLTILFIVTFLAYVNFKLYTTQKLEKEDESENEIITGYTKDGKPIKEKSSKGENNKDPKKWKLESQRLLNERSSFVKKVEQVEI